MDEGSDILDLVICQGRGRHTAISARAVNDGGNQFAVLIADHELRAEKIGTYCPASGIRAMAEGTTGAVQNLAARHCRGIGMVLREGKMNTSLSTCCSWRCSLPAGWRSRGRPIRC